MKLLVSILFIVAFVTAGYSDAYFDLDNKPDLLVTDYSDNELNACIKASSLKKDMCFTVSAENEDVEGLTFGLDIYNGLKGEIITDEHCCGIDKRFYIKFYRYSPKISNWLLYKKVNYGSILDEGYDYVDKYSERSYFSKSQVDLLGQTHKSNLVGEYTKKDVIDRLNYLLNTKIKGTRLSFFEVNELLFIYPLTKENLAKYNDIAYYLQKKDDHKLAIFLLKRIIFKSPDRVVAYLNIADSQHEMEQEGESISNYKRYLDLMRKNGKIKKVPKRVFKYLKENAETNIEAEEQQTNIDVVKTTTPELVKITKQIPEITPPKNTKNIKAEKAEPIKSASGSISLVLLASTLGLLGWKYRNIV